MDDLQLLAKLHIDGDRQGPGGETETLKAIELAGLSKTDRLNIADLGCGTGASTLVLAKTLNGQITSVDLFPEFLEVLRSRARKKGLQDSITTKAISMDALPFKENEFDVIWSEGAIYNIGFKNGICSWRKYLNAGGVLAVSEITWITQTRPKEVQEFWSAEYPEIATASEKIQILEESGYKVLGYFPLPISCWSENYYRPLQERFSSFLKDQEKSPEAQKLVELEKREIEFFEKFKDYYSYGFYIAMKV